MGNTRSNSMKIETADGGESRIHVLLRPPFCPWQRLADRDLTALVEWVRARLVLGSTTAG